MNYFMVFWPNMNLIADSLGWAVLHSLWQGALAAALVYAARTLTRERASETRYFTGIITLCALLCAFIGTFLYYYNTGAAALSAGIGEAETITLALPHIAEAATTNPLLRLGDFTGLIGVLWAMCFVALGTRYLGAFRLTHKLRRHGLSDLPSNWQARFRALVATSGVSPKVRAYFSKHVSSPITFGFFKPIVLVPAWFFTGMTPEQCEAVLLHELAHIRRHDYLTNILQIAIKTVFFYHPAVQFICKGLDTDREHACDDFAVMLTKNPEGLATALGTIRLKAARDGGVFALSADGRDAPLMYRLKRLMGSQATSMSKGTSRGIAATALISSAVALVMTLGATSSQAHPHKDTQMNTPDEETLAGSAIDPKDVKGTANSDLIYFDGKIYKPTSFAYSSDNSGYAKINGKKYPSKYAYSVYSNNGEIYVVKQKSGKRYIEIGNNWYRVNGTMPTPPQTPQTPQTPQPPAPPSTKTYWVSDEVRAATEARAEANAAQREAAFERAEEERERAMERAEEQREAAAEQAEDARERAEEQRQEALERAEEQREAAAELAEEQLQASIERNEDRFREDTERDAERQIRNYERQIAKVQRKIAHKERDLARDQAHLDRDIARIGRDIEKKQADMDRKLHNNPNMSQGELGRMQGEIGRLQGEIGRLQGQRGYGQGELGRLQGELGRLQGEIGRIQGKIGQKQGEKQRKKYYAMRDRLIPLLKKDGFMKSDNSKVTLKLTEQDIFINGEKLPNSQEGQYCNIVSDYMKREGEMKTIIIKPGYLKVSERRKNGNSTFIDVE